MYLRHLRLTDIRCFADVEIDFDIEGADNRKWTVLLGENGSGKSTVLKAIGAVMGGSDAVIELVGNSDTWIRRGAETGRIEAVISTKHDDARKIALEFHRGEGPTAFIARSQKTLRRLNEALAHTPRNYPIFAYGASRRLASGGRFDSDARFRHPRARSMASLFDRNAQLNPLEQWAMRLDYASDGERIEVVRRVLDDFLPDLHFAHIDKQAETLMFRTPDGLVPLDQLSDGYQNVAAWIGDLLYQITLVFDDYQQPLHARGLLVIDEVDLHLHPKWQRRLLAFLDQQLPHMQLVVTTHSVVTAQQAPEGALHYCIRRNGRAPEIEQFSGDPGTFLLNQLIVTEAFGHVSDESMELEQEKDRYRSLARQPERTAEDAAEMQRIASKVGSVPDDPVETAHLSPRQQELLRSMLAAKGETSE
ncbi:AAA family ATPase [Antarctobacter sp.]|uniref:AAA family ATPase n=1 Tax=Antarctobacter sp. TaxID=1872577 RepID=UPI003A950BE5